MTGAALLALLTLAACGREGQDQMSWARAALERNKDVEIVTADQESRTFTVRVKDSKELIKVRVDELVVAPATVASAPAGTLASAAAPPSTPTEAAPGAAMAPATPGEPASTEGAAAPTDSASRFVGTEGSGGAPQLEQPGGRVLRAGPGYTIKAAAGGAGAAQPASAKLSASGPGYSIQSVAGAPAGAQRTRETSVTSAALERRHEPIVCQGSRLLQIDNRNLQFDGDAVSAEDGCEIHITNSHITATGIGVQARAANVHIDNSSIEGNTASIDASDGAQVYAAGSHFTGMNRQLDTASFHDLGGNIWN
jgi:hypothetical protein